MTVFLLFNSAETNTEHIGNFVSPRLGFRLSSSSIDSLWVGSRLAFSPLSLSLCLDIGVILPDSSGFLGKHPRGILDKGGEGRDFPFDSALVEAEAAWRT